MASLLHNKNKFGFAMVEVLISLAVVSVLALAFQTLVIQMIKINKVSQDTFVARMYLKEAIEAARDLEQTASSWEVFQKPCSILSDPCNNPVVPSDFYLTTGEYEPGKLGWIIVSDDQFNTGKYTRTIKFEAVCRDQLAFPNVIVSQGSGGVCDESTVKIVASVDWSADSMTKTMALETYVYKPNE